MKLDARQVPGFCRKPGPCRIVLLHGEDEGLIRERSRALTQAVAGSFNDPFLVAELTRESWARIPAEMAALSMIGGQRVVLARDATDGILPHVLEAARGPGGALLILEAVGLAKGKLRSFVESAADGAAIACYPEEGRALSETIRSGLAASRVSIDADAAAWLSEVLGADRGTTRGEIEKLVLLAGERGSVTLEMAQDCAGNAAATAMDQTLLAATLGNMATSDAALQACLADGMTGVALLRAALAHLQKLHQGRLRMEQGITADEAVRAMRPPVFFKVSAAMKTALGLWSAETLLRAIEEARQAEIACKQTGSKAELLAQKLLQSLARMAQLRSRRTA